MTFPPLLVTAYNLPTAPCGLLLVDLNESTYEVLRPYPGPIYGTADALYLVRFLGALSRLEKYDRNGLCWMRRLRDCLDPHGIIQVGDELAICSTGTNEIIFLDGDGIERRRWSPDPEAEADSWHLNSLHGHEGRLRVSCFGRHHTFRGWGGNVDGAGMILDVPSGRPLVEGLSGPHDPHRIPGGWVVNDSHLGCLIHVPDNGPREIILQTNGFPRGLLLLPDRYVLGVSALRKPGRAIGNARVLVIDRRARQTVQSLPIPYPEIGHVAVAPSAEVLESMRREEARGLDCLLPERDAIAPAERLGAITVSGPLERVAGRQDCYTLPVHVTNRSGTRWATENDVPINISYQVINGSGGTLLPSGVRTRLPLPVAAGQSLTFRMNIDLTICHHLPAAAALRITLVQENVAWWEASEGWSPATLPLPTEYVTPPAPPPSPWTKRLRRALAR